MSGSRRRTYEPTGITVPASRVSLYTRDCPGERRPFKVTTRVKGHGERTESYTDKQARNNEANRLRGAVADGERFDVGSFDSVRHGGRPAPVAPEPAMPAVDLLQFLASHGQNMALDDKAKTATSRMEAHAHAVLVAAAGAKPPSVSARWQYLRAVLRPVRSAAMIADAGEREAAVAAEVAKRVANLTDEQRQAGEWIRKHQPAITLLTPDRVKAILDGYKLNPIKGGKSAGTTRTRKKNVLHHALEAAVTAGVLDANPMDKIPRERGHGKTGVRVVDRRIVMSPAQTDDFIRQVGLAAEKNGEQREDQDAPLRGYFSLMAREGLRPAEANAVKKAWFRRPTRAEARAGAWVVLELERSLVEAGCDWTDDGSAFADNPLKATDADGDEVGKTRSVPVCPESWALIEPELETLGADDIVFRTRSGGPMTSFVRSRIVEKARDRLFADPASPWYQPSATHPLRTMTAYALRHAAASAYLNSGMSVRVAADRLGHEPDVLLKIYASVMDGDELAANHALMEFRERSRQQAAERNAAA